MIFIPTEKLKPGMFVGRDFEHPRYKAADLMLFKRGHRLSEVLIRRLKYLKVDGLYIEDGYESLVKMSVSISDDLKIRATEGLSGLFKKAEQNNGVLDAESITSIKDVAVNLVDSIVKNKDISVGIVELQTHDLNTYAHSLSVSVLSIAIGTSLEFDRNNLEKLAFSALLHDIGKLDVPLEVLNKPAKLSNEEYNIIKNHVLLAARHIPPDNFFDRDVMYGIISHHEKYDGSGYPHGLAGEDIPLFARIISISDVYDALTGNRPYRKPIAPSEAIEYIMGSCGTAFDANIVRAFLRKVSPFPTGCPVQLSDDRIAVVIGQNYQNPLRPVVRYIGTKYKSSIIDLYNDPKAQNLTIQCINYDYMSPAAMNS